MELHGQHVRSFRGRFVRTVDTTDCSAGMRFSTVYHLALGRVRLRVPWLVWAMFS